MMLSVILDVREMYRDPHGYLAAQFGFPTYYGRNLDALHDLLTEIGDPTAVYWLAPEPLTREQRRILRVFKDAERENPYLYLYQQEVLYE